jgi:hypothetical protein
VRFRAYENRKQNVYCTVQIKDARNNVVATPKNRAVESLVSGLTFGFQLPWDRFGTVTQNSFVFANSGINKVILYGSLLKRDLDTGLLVEDDDGLNQNLTSNAIHEGVVTVR